MKLEVVNQVSINHFGDQIRPHSSLSRLTIQTGKKIASVNFNLTPRAKRHERFNIASRIAKFMRQEELHTEAVGSMVGSKVRKSDAIEEKNL